MKSTLAFVVLLIMEAAVAVRLNCEFRMNSEECKVSSLNVLEDDLEVTAVSGRHTFRKTNDNVKEIWITREVATEYMPTNICKFFENLQRMDIYGRQIKRITREAFTNCQKVTKVCILFTALTSLPDNLFEDLPEMKELLLYESNLAILPENLVAKNLKLTTFSARTNQLTIIDTKFGSAVTVIDLTSNLCVDKKFNVGNSTIEEVNEEIANKCQSSVRKIFKDKFAALQTKLVEKEAEITNLTSVNLNLRYLNSALHQKFEVMNVSFALLSEQNAERIKELEAIRSNRTQAVKVFEENIELKGNLSTCTANVADNVKAVANVTARNENLERTMKDLRAEMTAMQKAQREGEKNLLEKESRLDLLRFEYLNVNASLEECWQNLTLFNETIEEQDQHISDLEDDLHIAGDNCTLKLNELRGDSRESQNLVGISCRHHIHFVYFIILAVTFLVVIIASYCYMRRQASRMMIKNMINHEVNFKQIMANEES